MKKYLILCLILLALLVPILSVRIDEIEIVGNKEEWNTAENIKSELFADSVSKNSFLNLACDIVGIHRKSAFVQDYDIEWKSPTSIVVQIRNKNILGCVKYVSSYMYFDKHGVVVENSGRKLSGIPEVIGLDFGAVHLHEELEMYDEVAFSEILNIIRNINSYGIPADQLKYTILLRKTKEEFEQERKEDEAKKAEKKEDESSVSETTVLMTEEARQDYISIEDTIIVRDMLELEVGELTINLGSTDSLSNKLAELKGMLAGISDMRGTVHLEHYESNGGNKYFTFKFK